MCQQLLVLRIMTMHFNLQVSCTRKVIILSIKCYYDVCYAFNYSACKSNLLCAIFSSMIYGLSGSVGFFCNYHVNERLSEKNFFIWVEICVLIFTLKRLYEFFWIWQDFSEIWSSTFLYIHEKCLTCSV